MSSRALKGLSKWMSHGGQCVWSPGSKGREWEGPHQVLLSGPDDTFALTLSKMGPLKVFAHGNDKI